MRAGHQWPDAVPNRLAQLLLHTDPPSTALNATQVSWQFFAAHARKMLTVLVPEVLPYQPVECRALHRAALPEARPDGYTRTAA